MSIVTRFAPSPTGHLHIGGARTAIFSWLYAKHYSGQFVLRIEDTDTERSAQEYTDSILASMNWLGLDWQGDPVYQSKRFPLYQQYVQKLLDSGHAYWCDCSPEEVEQMREQARASGEKPKYNGKCRDLGLGPSKDRAVRLRVPEKGVVAFDDMIKGHIEFSVDELDDMILQRGGGQATYNMAVVVDDIEMKISHVIRGDDHVNNTPRQLLIYQALGVTPPVFGHVPMILGPDKQKLSKRHGAKAVIDYEQDGLLPEALVNYLVRLGWSHGDQEIFRMDELVQFFDGKSLNSSPASFDPEKLLWVNAQHMRAKNSIELFDLLLPYLDKHGLSDLDHSLIQKAIPLYQPRAESLEQMAHQMLPLLRPASQLFYEPGAVEKNLTPEGKAHVKALAESFAAIGTFNRDNIHQAINAYVEKNNLKFKAVGPALRVAILGSTGGPDLADIISLLGPDETKARLARALAL